MTIKYLSILLVPAFMYALTTHAQKLPNKQEASIYAPAVKIDGNALEWGNTMQAYNQATEISYTLANDADNLYLVCRATEVDVIQKMMLSGITLTINATNKNLASAPASVTYPIVPWSSVQINYDMKPAAPLKDDVVSLINKKISGQLKEIKVSGMKEFAEGTVPVYNDAGIVMAQNITKDKIYTSELALSLQYIRPLINAKGSFNYSITVNGLDAKVVTIGGNNIHATATAHEIKHGADYDNTPTYFTATYTLAVKP